MGCHGNLPMSMRRIGRHLTLCEVIRDINDLYQEDSPAHALIRSLCSEAEWNAKRLAKTLRRASQGQESLRTWWEDNPGRAEAIVRAEKTYHCGRSTREQRRARRPCRHVLKDIQARVDQDGDTRRAPMASRLAQDATGMVRRMHLKLAEYRAS